MAHLDIAGLRKAHGPVQVIAGVDLAVASGEFFTLLGPSGCGKTTTLRCVAGFIAPDAGDIRIAGASVLTVPPERRDFGVVFQNYALFPHLTVAENVGYGLQARRIRGEEARQRVGEALAMVQLFGLKDRLPRELSGGQQQRVALARAIVIRPRLLLLDEPLANLDAKLRHELRWLIRDVQRAQGITAIYVTHDHAEAMALSDRIAVMRHGRIAQVGTPREIYQRPRETYVASFTGETNTLAAKVIGELEPGRYRVTVAGSELIAAGPPGLAVGVERRLLARPESLSLSASGTGGISVRLDTLVYVGAALRCEVSTACREQLVLQVPVQRPFAPGDTLTLTIDPDHAWLMAAEPAGEAA
jgi:ABC-type Fe3+/spermidine/putrescine transport system ATPase subunit